SSRSASTWARPSAAAGAWLWRRGRGSWRRLVGWGALGTLVLGGVPAVTLLAAERERGIGFVHDRTVGFRTLQRRVLDRVGWEGLALCRCAPDRELRIPMPGGFETMASLFLPTALPGTGDDLLPGVVMVHGNVWNARHAAPYRLWATRMAEAGHAVLLFDQVGFGDSDDPYGQGPEAVAAAYDRIGQVNAAIDALLAHAPVDSANLTLIGHSGGVEPAIAAGTLRAGVQRIAVMVSPQPAGTTGPEGPTPERRAYFQRRAAEQHEFIYGREVPDWFTRDLTGWDQAVYDAGWDRLRDPGHPRFLLILGEIDEPAGHAFERSRLASLAAPANLLVVPRSDHYLNSAQVLAFVFYDRDVAAAFTRGLTDWLRSD
ncbi:MAG: alpha/beta hydrolase, partial [Gemmatimonadota bacterium]